MPKLANSSLVPSAMITMISAVAIANFVLPITNVDRLLDPAIHPKYAMEQVENAPQINLRMMALIVEMDCNAPLVNVPHGMSNAVVGDQL